MLLIIVKISLRLYEYLCINQEMLLLQPSFHYILFAAHPLMYSFYSCYVQKALYLQLLLNVFCLCIYATPGPPDVGASRPPW